MRDRVVEGSCSCEWMNTVPTYFRWSNHRCSRMGLFGSTRPSFGWRSLLLGISTSISTIEPLTNDHPSHTTTFRVTDSGFCSYTNPSRATIPLIGPHQCDSEGGRIRGVLLYYSKETRTTWLKDLTTQANISYKEAMTIPRDRKEWRSVGNPRRTPDE